MDAHKSEVLSINLSSADFLQSERDSEEALELRDGLKEMNARWDRLRTSLEDWRKELQRALMQCQVLKTHTKQLQNNILGLYVYFGLLLMLRKNKLPVHMSCMLFATKLILKGCKNT